MSFLALQDLMRTIGYSPTTAWVFPVIIDTTLAVCTLMLVALGDKPARRAPRVGVQPIAVQKATQTPAQSTKPQARPLGSETHAQTVQANQGQIPTQARPRTVQIAKDSAQTSATQFDADLASAVMASGMTTQPVETVTAVLAAVRGGASINAAATASGINYRTAQRIVKAAEERQRRDFSTAS